MKLTILGSGTMMPTKRRYPSSYLLECGQTKILLDCGHCTIARLTEMGVNLHSIDIVCISHYHTDHFSNFPPFVHARWVDDIQQTPQREHKPLVVVGPEALSTKFQAYRKIFWPEPAEHYPLDFLEDDQFCELGSILIVRFPINHVPWFKSVGFRISYNKRVLVYTGDLGAEQDKIFYRTIKGIDALLIEAGATQPKPNHFTAGQAAQIAKKYNIKRVILTHIRDEHLPYIQKVVDQYPDRLTIANDQETYEI